MTGCDKRESESEREVESGESEGRWKNGIQSKSILEQLIRYAQVRPVTTVVGVYRYALLVYIYVCIFICMYLYIFVCICLFMLKCALLCAQQLVAVMSLWHNATFIYQPTSI